MPPEVNTFDERLAGKAYDLARRWHLADVMGIGGRQPKDASKNDIAQWGTEQVRLCQRIGLVPSTQS